MRIPSPIAALAAAFLCAPVSAQAVYGGPDPDRQASTVFVFSPSFDVLASASISYSQPEWKDEYDARFDDLKGKKLRLGKNWWTSFSTVTAVEIAGTEIEAGSYFLGLECDADGGFHLLVFEATQAMKRKLMPFRTEQWKGGIRVPLALAKDSLEESRKRMEIEISAEQDRPFQGRFAIRWGKHELSADVRYLGGDTAEEASAAERK